MLSHFQGVRHENDLDTSKETSSDFSHIKPYIVSIRHASLDFDYEPIEDIRDVKELFDACLCLFDDKYLLHHNILLKNLQKVQVCLSLS